MWMYSVSTGRKVVLPFIYTKQNRIQYMHVTRKNKLNNSVCNEACHTFNFT